MHAHTTQSTLTLFCALANALAVAVATNVASSAFTTSSVPPLPPSELVALSLPAAAADAAAEPLPLPLPLRGAGWSVRLRASFRTPSTALATSGTYW